MASKSKSELSKLRREWYSRLRAEGFQDIEYVQSDGRVHRWMKTGCRTDRGSRLATQPHEVEATREYFSRAGEFLYAYRFRTSLERKLWEHHAAGETFREIAKECNVNLKVAFTEVSRLRAEMDAWAEAQEDELPLRPVRRHVQVDPANVITDDIWRAVEPLLPRPRTGQRGRPPKDHKRVLEALIWLLRTGRPWRELPPEYGSWKTVYTRFSRWQKTGFWNVMFQKIDHFEDTLSARKHVC